MEEDDSDLYDVVHSKTIVPPEGFDILDINVGSVCRVSFDGKFYKARVIDYGMLICGIEFLTVRNVVDVQGCA